MLNAKAIAKVFQNGIYPGVENIYLINKAGALVIAAHNHESVKTLGAIVSNIWSDYESCMANSENGESLKSMIIESGNGSIVAENVCNMFLCVQGGSDIGRLLETCKKLKEVLENPLQEAVIS